MKKVLVLIMFLIQFSVINAQVDIAGGMGISFVHTPSLNDYLANFSSSEEIPSFNSTVEFYIEGDYSLKPSFQLGLEYVYSLYSYNNSLQGFNYELNYQHYKPSILAYYVIPGKGYKIKFGGGAGIRILNLDQKIYGATESFEAVGYGLLIRAQGHTTIGGNFYINIGATTRYDHPGVPENDNGELYNNILDEPVNINSLSFSVDIGISYFFE